MSQLCLQGFLNFFTQITPDPFGLEYTYFHGNVYMKFKDHASFWFPYRVISTFNWQNRGNASAALDL